MQNVSESLGDPFEEHGYFSAEKFLELAPAALASLLKRISSLKDKMQKDSIKNNLHHAYVLSGETRERVLQFVKKELGIKTLGNPDVIAEQFETFTVEDARRLSERAAVRPLTGSHKVFIIVTNTMTREAQNALLKPFEEPTRGTHFFLILSSIELLLPTLRSRMETLVLPGAKREVSDGALKEAKAFLMAKLPERIKKAQALAESENEQEVTEFLNALEQELQYRLEEKDPTAGKSLSTFLFVRNYLSDRSASVKMLMEHLAMTLPASQ